MGNALELFEAALRVSSALADSAWAILVKQAAISGAVSLATMVVFLPACVLSAVFFARGLAEIWRGNSYDDRHGPYATALVIIVMVAIVIYFSNIGNAISGLLHPEYWALQRLLGK
jgi:hypothetical protein